MVEVPSLKTPSPAKQEREGFEGICSGKSSRLQPLFPSVTKLSPLQKTTPDSLKRFSPGACPSLGCTGDAQNNPKSTLGCSCSPDLLVCGDGPGAAPAVLSGCQLEQPGPQRGCLEAQVQEKWGKLGCYGPGSGAGGGPTPHFHNQINPAARSKWLQRMIFSRLTARPACSRWLAADLNLELSAGRLREKEEERSVTHTGLPILVSLANRAVSFSCSITYPYTPKFKDFRVSYFHVDLQGQTSSEKKISCQPGPGSENQTHTTACPIFLKLPNSSATGTYYCSVHWQDSRMIGEGTFILVRDTGYQEPPQSPQKLLLFCFVGILAVLSILATALLLWKKRQIWALWKHAAKKYPGPSATSSPGQPPSESVYTDLQRRETEVYDRIQSEASSPPTSQGLLSQEKQHKFEGDGEFNLVYENL
nr:PREDICTED: NFAT activation molecule 1 [Bos mutus]